MRPVVSSRGSAARVAGAAGNQFHGGYAATPAGRGTFGPSRSSAHGADCLREPPAPSLLASPGERRSPELATQGAANVRGRRERLALSVRQDSVGCPAETDWFAGAYLNTAQTSHSNHYEIATAGSTRGEDGCPGRYARGSRSGPGYASSNRSSYTAAGSNTETKASGDRTLTSMTPRRVAPAPGLRSRPSSDSRWAASPR